MTPPPLAWARKVASASLPSNAIPLFGNAPSFDWHRLSSLLASRFSLPHFSIHPKAQDWHEAHDMKQGLGSQVMIDPIVIAPLGTVFWMMSHEDSSKCISWMMHGGRISSEILQEGFYRYLLLEVLHTVQAIPPFPELSIHLSEEEPLLTDQLFSIDCEIVFESGSCWGRLAIPTSFRNAWVHHFEQMPSQYVPSQLSQQLHLQIGIQVGSVLLNQEQWKQMTPGNFVILDRTSYHPNYESGMALLMLNSTPLFNVAIKQNQVEIIDYTFYHEDNMSPNANVPQDEPLNLEPTEEEILPIKELPLHVNVELARLKMTLDQLMHLHPGNVLELPIHPDQSVSLIVNGQKVGRGELLYLGETLGVRILEIG